MTASADGDVVFTEVGPAERCGASRSAPRSGAGPGVFWLSGFNSDMRGTKAQALDAWAGEKGRACVRFDYSGHGESGGAFVDGTISRWLEESLAVFDRFCARAADRGGLLDGRLACAAAGATACKTQARTAGQAARRAGADRAGAGFYRRADVEGFPAEVREEIETKGLWLRPVGLWRSLSDHAGADRGWPQASRARELDQPRLSGSHPAGRAGC